MGSDPAALPDKAYRKTYKAISRAYMITVKRDEYGGYRAGYITTPLGVVGIYDQTGEPEKRTSSYTRLTFIANGRMHEVSWERTFSDAFLKTLAKRFAAEALKDPGK